MNKLVLSSIIFLGLSLTSAKAELTDKQLLEMIEGGMSDQNALCEKLGKLPAEDQKKLSSYLYTAGSSAESAKITEKFTHKENMTLFQCVSGLQSTFKSPFGN